MKKWFRSLLKFVSSLPVQRSIEEHVSSEKKTNFKDNCYIASTATIFPVFYIVPTYTDLKTLLSDEMMQEGFEILHDNVVHGDNLKPNFEALLI